MPESRSYYFAWCILLVCTLLRTTHLTAQGSSNPGVDPVPSANGSTGLPTLRLPVPLIVEDVVVLDTDDRPVQGLTAEDFEVAENGKPVAVRNFAENTAGSASEMPVKQQDLEPNTFTNRSRTDYGSSLNILLLDKLNTPMESQFQIGRA